VFLVGILSFLNEIPKSNNQGSFKEYKNIEDVSKEVSAIKIYIPKYFPMNVKWPPAKIYAQKNPFVAIIVEFVNEDNNVILSISQSSYKKFRYNGSIKFRNILEASNYMLDGKDAFLYAGFCEDNLYCSKIEFDLDDYRIIVVGKFSLPELLMIARSIDEK
jgi:hypothetical protein